MLKCMQGSPLTTVTTLRAELISNGFCFVDASVMRDLIGRQPCMDFGEFAASWDRLGDDRFMADGGRYRRRRHATFRINGARIDRNLHQPHYQSRDYNMLNGGIERWFDPVETAVADGAALQAIIDFGNRIFSSSSKLHECPLHVEVHQFRIEAGKTFLGQPTPEGLHRDGVDWVLAMLIARHNVMDGITKIHNLNEEEVGSFCFTHQLDAALVDDHRVYHAVTPITPIYPTEPAYRDVLIVTYKRVQE